MKLGAVNPEHTLINWTSQAVRLSPMVNTKSGQRKTNKPYQNPSAEFCFFRCIIIMIEAMAVPIEGNKRFQSKSAILGSLMSGSLHFILATCFRSENVRRAPKINAKKANPTSTNNFLLASSIVASVFVSD